MNVIVPFSIVFENFYELIEFLCCDFVRNHFLFIYDRFDFRAMIGAVFTAKSSLRPVPISICPRSNSIRDAHANVELGEVARLSDRIETKISRCIYARNINRSFDSFIAERFQHARPYPIEFR